MSGHGPPEGVRCAVGARLRGDPLLGTAVPARRWLFVEQHGGWTADAFAGLRAPDEDKVALARLIRHQGVRLMLMRRPGARAGDAAAPHRWCVVDTEPPVVEVWGQADEAGGLGAALAVLESPCTADLTPAPGLILVCVNGRKDPCCALAGRPVAAELARTWPDQVWECTHTGGDRFAANVIVLPEGVCYGGLSAATATGVLAAHREGSPDLTHLRGITGRGSHEQVALASVSALLGVLPWDRRRLTVAAHREDRRWWVEVDLDGQRAAVVEGHDEVRAAHHLTCGAVRATKATAPIVDRVVCVEESADLGG